MAQMTVLWGLLIPFLGTATGPSSVRISSPTAARRMARASAAVTALLKSTSAAAKAAEDGDSASSPTAARSASLASAAVTEPSASTSPRTAANADPAAPAISRAARMRESSFFMGSLLLGMKGVGERGKGRGPRAGGRGSR